LSSREGSMGIKINKGKRRYKEGPGADREEEKGDQS